MPNPKLPRKNCLHCKDECDRPEKIYCSNVCQKAYEFSQRYNEWINGRADFGNKAIRKFLIHQNLYKCAFCGISEWQEKDIVLEVDHIDGNWERSSPDNVRLLCPNCHSQTDTYKNKGGRLKEGRPYRKDYPSRYNRTTE